MQRALLFTGEPKSGKTTVASLLARLPNVARFTPESSNQEIANFLHLERNGVVLMDELTPQQLITQSARLRQLGLRHIHTVHLTKLD